MIHNNNFNFLRLLLAVLVLLSHSPELIDGNRNREILTRVFHTISFGELAVNCFFLLSGYLIIQSWQRSPQILKFLKKRILRIYPGFIVATLVCAFVVAPLGTDVTTYFAQFKLFNFLKNMLLLEISGVPPVFIGQPYPSVNGSLWTIKYEFLCYLLVAVGGMCGIFKRRFIWLVFTIFIVLYGNINPKKIYSLLSFFSAGGCFYLFRERIRYNSTLMLIALPIVVLGLYNIHSVQLLLPTIGAYIFFGFAFANVPVLTYFKTYPDISYGVYLYGWPTQKLLLWYFQGLSPWLLFVLACGISCVCGLLSWHFVERPFLQLKTPQTKEK